MPLNDPAMTAPASRLPVRVPPAIRERAERAAQMKGMSLNALIIHAVAEVSEKIIQQEESIRLSAEGSAEFWKLLHRPAKPNAALAKAARKHQRVSRA
jgi:uncharacterized protein (DUF1778 family)